MEMAIQCVGSTASADGAVIEGSVTMTVAIVCAFLLPDLPRKTRWLSDCERALAQRRMSRDTGEADTGSPMTQLEAAKSVAVRHRHLDPG